MNFGLSEIRSELVTDIKLVFFSFLIVFLLITEEYTIDILLNTTR